MLHDIDKNKALSLQTEYTGFLLSVWYSVSSSASPRASRYQLQHQRWHLEKWDGVKAGLPAWSIVDKGGDNASSSLVGAFSHCPFSSFSPYQPAFRTLFHFHTLTSAWGASVGADSLWQQCVRTARGGGVTPGMSGWRGAPSGEAATPGVTPQVSGHPLRLPW